MTTTINNTFIENMNREKVIPKRKLLFADKLRSLLDEYDTCLVIEINNIGSKQIAEMRKQFHNKQTRFLFGKNTLIRKVIRDFIKERGDIKLKNLMDLIKGNCGLVFTKRDIKETYKELIRVRKLCAAKINSIAPSNVNLNIGPTNIEPMKTSIFQSMNIETRINRGQIDIITPKIFIQKGEKINASHTYLLSLLNIKPFIYGIKVKSIYNDGNIIQDTSFMDMTIDDITNGFYSGLYEIAALCLSLRYPSIINIPHEIINAYRSTIGLSMMLDTYSWDGLDAIQNILQYAEIMSNENTEQVEIGKTTNDDSADNDDDDDSLDHGPFCQCTDCGGTDTSSSESESDDDEDEESSSGLPII